MKKWTIEQVEAARVNDEKRENCEPWMREMFDECGSSTRECLYFDEHRQEWMPDASGVCGVYVYRISEKWPPAEQIEDPKPTPADFSTQYMLGGEPYHPEDDETELQRLIDGRDDMFDGIKAIRARLRRFKKFVAKQEGVKG